MDQDFKQLSDLPDGELVHQWKDGNELAAEILVGRHSLQLVGWIAQKAPQNNVFISSEDIAQSTWRSFFGTVEQSRVDIHLSASIWNLLATFARRKLARKLEWALAKKRGGDFQRHHLQELDHAARTDAPDPSIQEELEALLTKSMTEEMRQLLDFLLVGMNQTQIAERWKVDQRTVRRRVNRLRKLLGDSLVAPKHVHHECQTSLPQTTIRQIDYSKIVLGHLVGHGGFGKVYRSTLQADQSIVAVKFLRKAFWQDEVVRNAFLQEINLAAKIRHPHVVTYLGQGASPHGGPYLVMEWIEGRPLTNLERSKLNPFADWVLDVAKAIHEAHRNGVIHGDLTPANLMLRENGQIVIIDFGFSVALSKTGQQHPRSTGGTLGFAAPEQVADSFGKLSMKTDVYGIGALVHWFVYGSGPNDQGNFHATFSKTVGHSQNNQSLYSDAPDRWRRVLQRTLSPHQSERCSMPQLLELLS